RAIIRRGGQSLNALWDNHAAVLGGDYLVARATELLGKYENHELILNAVQCVREMAEGELKFFTKSIKDFTINNCKELARKKTAMLFACSASTPALLEKSPERNTLFYFGEYIGIVFQFIDDLLDLTQDLNILGKPRYSDIIEQKITLPILLLWKKMDIKEKERFNSVFGKPLTKKEQKWIKEQLEKYEIRKNTIQYAEKLKVLAIKKLDKFPDSEFKKSLINVCNFIVQRQN
ncbi:MAG TPA: polyprenyl synthetase family protein, partial [Candidatus Hydrogenedens sp.]|nr:polyprenyl synthetase family protein [Candidatus Hydrogenedens sp.]